MKVKAATTFTRVHILSSAPRLSFDPVTYPSLAIEEGSNPVPSTDVTVTLTGDVLERRAFADRLRYIADRIEAWTEEDGRESVVPEETEGDVNIGGLL